MAEPSPLISAVAPELAVDCDSFDPLASLLDVTSDLAFELTVAEPAPFKLASMLELAADLFIPPRPMLVLVSLCAVPVPSPLMLTLAPPLALAVASASALALALEPTLTPPLLVTPPLALEFAAPLTLSLGAALACESVLASPVPLPLMLVDADPVACPLELPPSEAAPADELDPDATEPGPLTEPPALEFELPELLPLDAEAEESVLVDAPLPVAAEEEFALAVADWPLLFVACELPEADALAEPVPDVLADVLDEAETETPPLPVEAPAFDLPLALGPLLPA